VSGERMRSDTAAQPAVLAAPASRRAELAAALAGPDPAGVVIVARR
jgi:hypothetical protein